MPLYLDTERLRNVLYVEPGTGNHAAVASLLAQANQHDGPVEEVLARVADEVAKHARERMQMVIATDEVAAMFSTTPVAHADHPPQRVTPSVPPPSGRLSLDDRALACELYVVKGTANYRAITRIVTQASNLYSTQDLAQARAVAEIVRYAAETMAMTVTPEQVGKVLCVHGVAEGRPARRQHSRPAATRTEPSSHPPTAQPPAVSQPVCPHLPPKSTEPLPAAPRLPPAPQEPLPADRDARIRALQDRYARGQNLFDPQNDPGHRE